MLKKIKSDINWIIKVYNESDNNEKIIFIDFLEDLLNGDISIKKTVPRTFEYRYFEQNYRPQMLAVLNKQVIKKLWKNKFDKKLKQFFESLTIESWWTLNFWAHNTISSIATWRIRNFTLPLQKIIDNNVITLNQVFVKRKVLINRFKRYWIIFLPNDTAFWKDFTSELENIEENRHNDPFLKLLYEYLKEIELSFWKKMFNDAIEELEWLENKIDVCRFDKEEIKKILRKINNNTFEYNKDKRELFYWDDKIHTFKTINMRSKFCEIAFSHPKSTEINFKDFSNIYDTDDSYYNDILRDKTIEKIKWLIDKLNQLVKEKTKNKDIILFSQEKDDSNHYIIRNY